MTVYVVKIYNRNTPDAPPHVGVNSYFKDRQRAFEKAAAYNKDYRDKGSSYYALLGYIDVQE
jgi:hypothetical protein